jgi:glycosyltransferase involved in cell wall biosynthesis
MGAANTMKVSIVIPCYNEQAVLEGSISHLYHYLALYCRFDWEIIIVDNGSTDETLSVARMLTCSYRHIQVIHLEEKGRGRALTHAWATSDADILTYMDVDLSTNLRHFPILVHGIMNGEFDLATGSRLHRLSNTKRSLKREILSRGYNLMVRSMFDTKLTDFQCGFKAITRKAWDNLAPYIGDNEWFFDTELLLKAENAGCRVLDLPVEWHEDADSRVKIINTAWKDIKGLYRVHREFSNRSKERAEWKLT